VKKYNKDYKVILKEIKIPELSAKIMAEFVATQIE
jgi:ribosomal protein S3